jgi:hypothetical protein
VLLLSPNLAETVGLKGFGNFGPRGATIAAAGIAMHNKRMGGSMRWG